MERVRPQPTNNVKPLGTDHSQCCGELTLADVLRIVEKK